MARADRSCPESFSRAIFPEEWNERGLRPMSGLILETETESITFGEDGHLLHTHKTTFAQRRSLNTWPDFQSAKKAVEADLGHIRWGDPE